MLLKTQSLGALALFVALGGTGYAAATGSIDSREIKNNTIRGGDVKNGSLGSGDVKNGSLTAADIKLPSGPAGSQGPPGAQGPQGVAGTARAYAHLNPSTCTGGPPATCTVSRAKGVTAVRRATTGIYCVTAPGLDPATTPPVISPGNFEDLSTSLPAGLTSAIWATGFVNACVPSEYQVYTQVVTPVFVRNATDNGVEGVANDSDTASNDVPFVIAIP